MEQSNSEIQTPTSTTTEVVNRKHKTIIGIVKWTFVMLLMNFVVAGIQLRLGEATFNFNDYTLSGIVMLILASCIGSTWFVTTKYFNETFNKLYWIGLVTSITGWVMISFSFNNLIYGITISLISVFMSMMFDFIYYICTIDLPIKNKNKGELRDAN